MTTRSQRLNKLTDLAGARLRREIRIMVAIAATVVVAGFALALHFVQPAPPSKIVMSTGRTDGDYYRYGLEYRRLLAQQGVDLQLVTSDGALENIGRLMDPSSGVDVAFFQSGTGFSANAPHVESLGTLYYEPLWVFYRGAPIDDLRGLNGKRIAIGPEQSGTRPLALQLSGGQPRRDAAYRAAADPGRAGRRHARARRGGRDVSRSTGRFPAGAAADRHQRACAC